MPTTGRRSAERAAGSRLTVLPVYGEDANYYVAKAPDDPALRYYSDLGLSFVPVTARTTTGRC